MTPLIIMVAPNGARKTHADHPALPITPAELANTAAACREAGAGLIHLHVRSDDSGHTLDADRYRQAITAIRQAVGDDMIIHVTSEAVGIYQPDQQMRMVRELRPEMVSLAVRELIPDTDSEAEAGAFFEWLHRERIVPQYILYSADDSRRFDELVRRGVIPGERHFVLFVLGRYSAGQTSSPHDLLPFIDTVQPDWTWMVCAFGARENACALTAAALDGHCRVGFENNMQLCDGSTAPDNAALVSQLVAGARLIGRTPADADAVRQWFSTG